MGRTQHSTMQHNASPWSTHLLWRTTVAATLVVIAMADLPVHCTKSELIGKWTIEMSKADKSKGDIKCSDEAQQYQSKAHNFGLGERNFEPISRFLVEFEEPLGIKVYSVGTSDQTIRATTP